MNEYKSVATRGKKTGQTYRLPPVDSCFRALNHTGAPQNIAALAILTGTPGLEIIAEKVNSLLAEFPRLSSILYGRSWPCEYLQVNFNPSDHCHSHSISGNSSSLIDHATQILIKPFKNNAPLWEIHVISSSDSYEYSVLLFKLHHSLGDGMSGLYFFHRLLGLSPQRKRGQRKEKSSSLFSVLPFLLREVIRKRPALPFHGPLSEKRVILAYALPNNTIKQFKQSLSCTSFSVVLSIISTALTRYLESRGTSDHDSSFRALIPVTIRGRSSISDLGNEIGGASINIPLGIEDMKKSTEIIHGSLKSLMYKDAYSAYHLCARVFSGFPLPLQTALCSFAARRLNGICTFLQAPSQKLAIDNSEVLHEFAIPALLPEQGLSFGFIKQGEYMNISVILDSEVITDSGLLDSCMVDTLDQISSDYKTGTALAIR